MKRLLALLLVVAACSHGSKPAPPTPPPPKPSGEVHTCEEYCHHVRDDLHCLAGQPTKKGATCEEVCHGHQDQFNLRDFTCSIHANSCVAVESCEE